MLGDALEAGRRDMFSSEMASSVYAESSASSPSGCLDRRMLFLWSTDFLVF